MSGGYVSLWRQLFDDDHALAPTKRDPASRLHAWVYIIQLAQHDDYTHAGVVLNRGDVLLSEAMCAAKWEWTKSRTHRFIKWLISESMIEPVSESGHGTVYRVVKYEDFNTPQTGERTTHRTTQRDDIEPDANQTRTRREPITITDHKEETLFAREESQSREFNELWKAVGNGTMLKAERAYYRAVPEKVSHEELLRARLAYDQKQSDPRYRMLLGKWIDESGWADPSLKKSGIVNHIVDDEWLERNGFL